MGLKFSMRQEGDRLVIPAHGEDGGWIVKTPDGTYPGLVANEAAVMRLAGELGIEVPEVHVRHRNQVDELGEGAWPSDEDEAYVVRRFDRTAEGRVHIEDFAQVLGRFGLGEGKYRSTVEAVAAIAYRGRDHASLREMVCRKRGRPPQELVTHLPGSEDSAALTRLRSRMHGRLPPPGRPGPTLLRYSAALGDLPGPLRTASSGSQGR